MVQFTFMGVTLYLHRDATHRSLDLHPALRHVFRFWLWMSSGIVTKEWVAVHRKHHARCETADDPHSPVIFGLKKVLLEGAELYQAQARNPETTEKFGRGTPDDWMERNVYSALSQLRHRADGRDRPAAVRRAGHHHHRRADAGESADGGRRDQRHRPLLRLSQFRMPGRGAQRRAVGLPGRRRRAAQQSPRVPELGEVLGAALGVRHRLAVHPHVPGARSRPGDSRRAGARAESRRACTSISKPCAP